MDVTDIIYERRFLEPDEHPVYPNACTLLNYWNEKCSSRLFPAWQDLDLLDLWQIAPTLIVKDVIDSGADFLNRYWGTMITQRSGFDASGKRHTDIYKDQPLGPQMDAYREVVEHKRANMVYRNSTFIAGKDFITYNSLNLPLGSTDAQVENIICAVDYEDEKQNIYQ